MNHLGDTNKMVRDTPRMDASAHDDGAIWETGCDIERELNGASVEIEEKRKDIVYLATEKAKLEERIKRLEEANNELRAEEARLLNTNGELERRIKRLEEAGDRMRLFCADPDDCFAWDEAKEAKL